MRALVLFLYMLITSAAGDAPVGCSDGGRIIFFVFSVWYR